MTLQTFLVIALRVSCRPTTLFCIVFCCYKRRSDQWQLRISYKKCSISQVGNSSKFSNGCLVCVAVVYLKSKCAQTWALLLTSVLLLALTSTILLLKLTLYLVLVKIFLPRDRDTLACTFCVHERPLLGYACSVWSPYHVTDVRKLESVQRRFTQTPWPHRTWLIF